MNWEETVMTPQQHEWDDNYYKGKKTGIREVVEWIEEHQMMTYERGVGEVAFNHIIWHTKLKEWGVK